MRDTAIPGRQPSRLPHWVRFAAGLMLLAVVAYSIWTQQSQPPPDVRLGDEGKASWPDAVPSGKATPKSSTRPAATRPTYDEPATPDRTIVSNQTIYDLEGEVAYQGNVDLTDTLARIEAGQRLRFPNDGSTFQNRERRLPKQSTGYYKEYVHPTPGLSGPGPQRIVVGQNGEAYYTPDHYETFQRVDE